MGLKRAKSTFVLYNSYGITYLTIGDVLVSVVFCTTYLLEYGDLKGFDQVCV